MSDSVRRVDERTGRRAAPTLQISGLHLTYGGPAALNPALNDVDLDVARGEFVALLGPSGCGKTSLLRSIAGFVHPQRGSILLNGRDVASVPTRERNIGRVFQNYALCPHMSVLENVRFGLECSALPKREATERAQAALSRVGLAAFAERRPKQLSGGQQQRVALARAIVIEPDLLLLDEPLGALDKQLRVQMQTELKGLQRSLGITAVFVTHDQEEAMAMADRIVVMRDGTIQQIDPPERLFADPRTGWVSNFVSAGNLFRGRLREASPGRFEVEAAPGCVFAAPGPPGSDQSGAVLFAPYHRVRVEQVDQGGVAVAAHRYLGLAVELHAACGEDVVRIQLPIDRAQEFPVGARIRIWGDPADCRLLPA